MEEKDKEEVMGEIEEIMIEGIEKGHIRSHLVIQGLSETFLEILKEIMSFITKMMMLLSSIVF